MKKAGSLDDYRSIFKHAPDGMYLFDHKGNFLLVNNHFCQILGYSRDEILQMNIRDTYLESEVDLVAERIKKLNTHKTAIVERSFRRKDGTSFYAQINLKITGGRCVQGIVREQMLQKKLSEQLDNNEERFRQMTEHIRDVFFLIDLKTSKFLYISPAYEKIWNQPIASLLLNSNSWMTSIHPDDRKRIMPLYQQQLKTGFINTHYRILLNDGSIRHIHARTFPVYNKHNQVYRSAGVAEDVTEQVLITQERLDNASKI